MPKNYSTEDESMSKDLITIDILNSFDYIKFNKELNNFANISKLLITDPISVLNLNILALMDIFHSHEQNRIQYICQGYLI